MQCSLNFVKSLQYITASFLYENVFVVGISWRVIWIFVEKYVVSILSRPATIKRKQYRTCDASKIKKFSRCFICQTRFFTVLEAKMLHSRLFFGDFDCDIPMHWQDVFSILFLFWKFRQFQTSLVILEKSSFRRKFWHDEQHP